MRRPASRGGGFTLVEVLVASGVALVLMATVLQMLVSGARLFVAGVGAARGPEAAILLMDRLEQDLVGILQVPGDPRPPVSVEADGRRISFFRFSPEDSDPNTVVGEPGQWALKPSGEDLFVPVRDGQALEGILVRDLEFQLVEPDEEAGVPGWFLVVRAAFPTSGLSRRSYQVARLIHLRQPSSNFLHFLAHGHEIPEDAVQMLPPLAAPGFRDLGAVSDRIKLRPAEEAGDS